MAVTIKRGNTVIARIPARTPARQASGTMHGILSGHFVAVPEFNNPEVQAEVRALRQRVTASPEAASKFLKGAGILTKTGRLSKRFGG